jgi:ComF family protein
VWSLVDPRAAAAARAFVRECVDALYPPACPLCAGVDLGDGLGCARHRLPRGLSGPRCRRCARALPPAIADGERCAECRSRSPGFERVIALADYRAQPEIQEWILALKYGHRADLARVLGAALGAHWSAESAPVRAPVLVPVPLHVWRRLERGYDQAHLLARAAADVAGVPMLRALRRARATGVQGAPGSTSRTANVRDAFAPAPFAARRVRGRDVWIVDDVVTSGSTAAECARMLRRMGAESASVLALARASG